MTADNSSNFSDRSQAQPLDLPTEQLTEIAQKKATCPFVGSLVKSGELSVHNSAERPLANIEDIVEFGDSGGGDLGRRVLKIFARGNHRRIPDENGEFKEETPSGMLSLDFAGSQGAHPGHSGILLGDPDKVNSGRFSAADFDRLKTYADETGRINAKAIGEFIVENIVQDKNAKVLPVGEFVSVSFDILREAKDLVAAKLRGRPSETEEDELLEKLTELAGADNIIGSSGEFGLLFAFLANGPDADMEGDPSVLLKDIEMMVHYQLPSGWQTWPKNSIDWIEATAMIYFSASKAYLKQKLTG